MGEVFPHSLVFPYALFTRKGLETATFEGALAMLAAFVLTLPIEDYLPYLPADGNMIA